jgi:translation initiation factor IF-3
MFLRTTMSQTTMTMTDHRQSARMYRGNHFNRRRRRGRQQASEEDGGRLYVEVLEEDYRHAQCKRNDDIDYETLLVVDQTRQGAKHQPTPKTMARADALAEARRRRCDLVLVGRPKEDLPVTLMIDPENERRLAYGRAENRALREKERIEREAAQKRKKEMRFGSRIAEHDVQIKVAKLKSLLRRQHPVRCSITFPLGESDDKLAVGMLMNIFDRVDHLATRGKISNSAIETLRSETTRVVAMDLMPLPNVADVESDNEDDSDNSEDPLEAIARNIREKNDSPL